MATIEESKTALTIFLDGMKVEITTECIRILPSDIFGAFQFTLPARGATRNRRKRSGVARISIHAPCEGSDFP